MSRYTDMPEGYSVQERGRSGFQVNYTLADGKTLNRNYSYEVWVDSADLNDPASVTAKLDALANLPQVVEYSYGLSDERADDIIEIGLRRHYIVDGYEAGENVSVSKDAYEKVFRAVLADLAEGNIGRRYLLNDEERQNNCFLNDLEITFYRGKSEEPVSAMISDKAVLMPEDISVTTEAGIRTERITVTLQTTAKHTLAALAEQGVLEKEVDLLTQAQYEAANTAWAENGESWNGVDLTDFAWDTLGG